jgi:hypothetical protein
MAIMENASKPSSPDLLRLSPIREENGEYTKAAAFFFAANPVCKIEAEKSREQNNCDDSTLLFECARQKTNPKRDLNANYQDVYIPRPKKQEVVYRCIGQLVSLGSCCE